MSLFAPNGGPVTSDGSTTVVTKATRVERGARDASILTVADIVRQNADEQRLGVELDRSDSPEPQQDQS